jgi:hypothetical protein
LIDTLYQVCLEYLLIDPSVCYHLSIRRVWRCQREVIRIRKSMKTDDTMAKRKRTKGQTTIYKTYT